VKKLLVKCFAKLTKGGCGILISSGGNGEANVEFLLSNVYQRVDEYLRLDYGSSLTRSRKGTFLFGYSLGGLFSCYAAWTRPEVSMILIS
jgi:predicted alpha/beta superfamily hydrolase